MNDFGEYQEISQRTAEGFADPDSSPYQEGMLNEHTETLMFLTLGLNGESGEVTEKVKKYVREDDPTYLEGIEDELGDMLWYMAQLCTLLDADLGEDVAFNNIEKLKDRDERGVIFGEGVEPSVDDSIDSPSTEGEEVETYHTV